MKILLILPRIKPQGEIPKYNYTFPLGFGYISAVIKKAGYNVDCLNLNHEEGSIKEILQKNIKKEKYDVIATGNIWFGYLSTKEIIETIKIYSPNSKIILGGALMTSNPKLIMENIKPTFGIIGEGEITILELLNCIEKNYNLKKIKGIIYIDKKGIIKITEKRELIKDLDSLPYPDFDSFGFEKYLSEMYPNQHYANNLNDYPRTYSILMSRGCPFNCSFCYHSLGGYRERTINNIIKEIKWAIKKYNINIINILDDSFGIKKERIYEFCNEIKKLNIKWTCQMVVNCVNKEILKKMKDAGCHIISYGFESYNQNILNSMRKPITPEKINFAFKNTLKVGISVQGNFLFGDIAETNETSKETLNYWKKNCLGQLNLSFIQPYPGSEIYNYCLKKGIIKDEIEYIKKASTQEIFINMTNKMNNDEINNLIIKILNIKKSGYYKVSIPKNIKPMNKKNRWEIEIDCPFCKKTSIYKNYYLIPETFYKDFIICRECNMRYNILRPI